MQMRWNTGSSISTMWFPPKLMALNRTWGMKDDNDFKGGQGAMEDELQWEVQLFEILEKTKPVCLKCRCRVNGFLPMQHEDESAGLCNTQRVSFCSKYKATTLRH